jgi:hypothetical protein
MMKSSRTKTERVLRFLLSLLLSVYGGWMFMLAVGIVHHEWIPACPTIGFWWSVLLASLIRSALYNFDLDNERSAR